jgi:hypothetical protein
LQVEDRADEMPLRPGELRQIRAFVRRLPVGGVAPMQLFSPRNQFHPAKQWVQPQRRNAEPVEAAALPDRPRTKRAFLDRLDERLRR